MSFGDGVDPVEDELMDSRKRAHNLRVENDRLQSQLSSARAEVERLKADNHKAMCEVTNARALLAGSGTKRAIDEKLAYALAALAPRAERCVESPLCAKAQAGVCKGHDCFKPAPESKESIDAERSMTDA